MKSLIKLIISGIVSCLFVAQAHCQERVYNKGKIYVSAESTNQLMDDTGFKAFASLEQPDEDYPTIMIDPDKTFQTIIGFGGAFTDAASINFNKLTKANQEKFLKATFDPVDGMGYSLARTTIGSSDYSAESYSYDDVKGDKDLTNFSIAHDEKYRIPLIKRALEASKGNLKIFASPWSPPAWMKTNNNVLYGGKLKHEYDQTWANYFVKYIKAYQSAGIPLWGISVQNEAMATQVWESCIYTATEEKNFVRDYLGPALWNNNLKNIKLMIWDHNRGIMYQRAEVAYNDPKASKYIWGMAFHWYVGNHFDNVRIVHDTFPNKNLLMTEASTGGSWNSATHIAKNMILDLNNWAKGYTRWNLMLNLHGGPRHAGGISDVPKTTINSVTVDTASGQINFNPTFYAFGQFSKFIRPGAKRISCTSNNDNLIATAFLNTDGEIAVVIENLEDHKKDLQLWVAGKAMRFTSPAKGIITVVL